MSRRPEDFPLPFGEDAIVRLAPDTMNRFRLLRAVVLADANPNHHKANLVIGPDGERQGGCQICYDDLAASGFVNAWKSALQSRRSEAARQFAGRVFNRRDPEKDRQLRERAIERQAIQTTMEDFKRRFEEAEEAHSRVRPVVAEMPDLKHLPTEGGIWGDLYQAVAPASVDGSQRRVKAVASINEIIAFLDEASASGRTPIHVVACLCHGTRERALIGGEILRDDRRQLLPSETTATRFVTDVERFLAPDVRWIFYACGTGGQDLKNGAYPEPDGVSRPNRQQPDGLPVMALKFQQQLARTKPQAEVWGHLGKGDALTRPYWRRFRSPAFASSADTAPVVSLFDVCFPPEYVDQWVTESNSASEIRQQMYGDFKENLLTALRPPDFASSFRGISSTRSNPIVHLPMWPVDFEHTELARFCQAAWERNPDSRALVDAGLRRAS